LYTVSSFFAIMCWLLHIHSASGPPPLRSTATSQVSLKVWVNSHWFPFPQLRVDQLMNRVWAPSAPLINFHQFVLLHLLFHYWSMMPFKWFSKLACLCLSKWIAVFTWCQPACESTTWHKYSH